MLRKIRAKDWGMKKITEKCFIKVMKKNIFMKLGFYAKNFPNISIKSHFSNSILKL